MQGETCYICFGDSSEEPFMDPNPCICKGTIKIHESCYETIVMNTYNTIICKTCGICKTPYTKKVTYKKYYYSGAIYGEGDIRGYYLSVGYWKYYYDNRALPKKRGILKMEGTYDNNGIETGVWKYYFETGELRKECTFDKGRLNGLYTLYHRNGKILKKSHYENDQPIWYETFNKNGVRKGGRKYLR